MEAGAGKFCGGWRCYHIGWTGSELAVIEGEVHITIVEIVIVPTHHLKL